MSRHSQRPERAKVTPVLQSDQAEWNDHQQNGLLVDVIAKQEGRVAAQCYSSDEVVPGGVHE